MTFEHGQTCDICGLELGPHDAAPDQVRRVGGSVEVECSCGHLAKTHSPDKDDAWVKMLFHLDKAENCPCPCHGNPEL